MHPTCRSACRPPILTPAAHKCHRQPCSNWKLLAEVAKTLWPDGLSVITKHLHTHPQSAAAVSANCVCVCVTFSTSPRYVLSYLGASQESGCRAPRSSANSLLMHHLCPCAPCGLRPLGSLAALKLCLVGRRKTKLCRYSNWRETGAKCCSNATSALSLLTFNRLGVGCPGSGE